MRDAFIRGGRYAKGDFRKYRKRAVNKKYDMKMPFGKYKGKNISNIDDIPYLKWLSEEN